MIFPWHRPVWDRLVQGENRGHHALLLHGPRGCGESDLAMAYAQSLLCSQTTAERMPCGQCEDCRWFDQQTHHDFRVISPAADDEAEGEEGVAAKPEKRKSKQISVAQIRELQDFLSLSTRRDGARRAVVIDPAEAMNAHAANSLLKMLEEPPARTTFILVAPEFRRLLPTIVSRCRRVPLPLPEPAAARAWLEAQGVSRAGVALAAAGGSPLLAQELAEPERENARRSFLEKLGRANSNTDLLALAGQVHQQPPEWVLRWLSTWLLDLLLVTSGAKPRYNTDFDAQARKLSARLRLDGLFDFNRQLSEDLRAQHHPLNHRLVLERLLLAYGQLMGDTPAP